MDLFGTLLWTPLLVTNIGAGLGIHMGLTVAKARFVRKGNFGEDF
jgi:hypothetical protein